MSVRFLLLNDARSPHPRENEDTATRLDATLVGKIPQTEDSNDDSNLFMADWWKLSCASSSRFVIIGAIGIKATNTATDDPRAFEEK